MIDKAGEHQRLILDQFTKQAVPFSQMQNHSPELLVTVPDQKKRCSTLPVVPA